MPILGDGYTSRPQSPDTRDRSSTSGRISPALTRIASRSGSRAGSTERKALEGFTTAFSNIQATSTIDGRGGLSRAELIERIKRQQSPTWLHRSNGSKESQDYLSSRGNSPRPSGSPLLPALELRTSRETDIDTDTMNTQYELGLQIARPKSALHSGDFRPTVIPQRGNEQSILSTSPVVPWHQEFPAAAYAKTTQPVFSGQTDTESGITRPARRYRPASRSSFVLIPTTSPLVQESNNTDNNFSPKNQSRTPSKSPERNNRRHTFSPRSFQTFRATHGEGFVSGLDAARHPPPLRKESTYPYQAHQPRRSLTNFPGNYSASSPQSPYLRARRPSVTSDSSPLHHAPMVGSYEESILRGRMSTTPSKPLNFVAQIGVLGTGHCRSNLKCPPHVSLPFPAVFYSYGLGNGKLSNDSPSPYVGMIDLENSLKHTEDNRDVRRRRNHSGAKRPAGTRTPTNDTTAKSPEEAITIDQRRQEKKKKRRSTSPKAPLGGCYRIPAQGQLQIIIKNPNKTAVKLFLVPYDVSDMEAGQKTFIRQRSYSAGPIIDMPLTSRTNYGTDRPEAALSNSDDPNDRPVLRYLIHLNICCPSRGRYYLYKSVRVVFANRVPDGKEKLRNEVQLPEPRYSSYKPSREPMSSNGLSMSAAVQYMNDGALRRRSGGLGSAHNVLDGINGIGGHLPTTPYPRQSSYTSPSPAMSPTPFDLSRLDESRPNSRDPSQGGPPFHTRRLTRSPFQSQGGIDVLSPVWSNSGSTSSPSFQDQPSDGTELYEKLSPGSAGYGGIASSFTSPQMSPGGGDSLLARKLRGLDMGPYRRS